MKSTVSTIIKNVYECRAMTRKELSTQTHLSPNHVNALVSKMIDREQLVEDISQDGSLGRPAALLSINPKIGHVVGLDIGVNETRAVLTDLNGKVIASKIQTTQIVPDREVILQNIIDLITGVCELEGIQPKDLAGIGISVLGIVNVEKGIVLAWTNEPAWEKAWVNFNLREALQERLQVTPMILENTVRAMGVNAHRFGPAQGINNFLYVFLGSNTGSSVFLNGQPYFGSMGIAGELGHVTVDDEGPWCSCGNRGCLEAMASTPAVLRRVLKRLDDPQLVSILRDPYEKKQLTLKKLIEAAASRDKVAYQIMDETGGYVGKILAFALNLLGPEMVVLAGPLAQGSDVFLQAVQHQVNLHALQQVSKFTQIVCDKYDQFSGTRGASLLALDRIFKEENYILKLLQRSG
jgi:N-acetylglucosamine repressor